MNTPIQPRVNEHRTQTDDQIQMAESTEELENERSQLRETARSTDDPDERREAIRRLAELDRDRNRETYDELANE